SAIRLIGRPARTASFRHRSINRNSAVASGSSFFNGWRSTPGTTPLTSQLALLISTTTTKVEIGSNAVRLRLRSLTWATGQPPSVRRDDEGATTSAARPIASLGQDFTLSRATPSAVSEHLSELIGFPISKSFPTYCVCLELRSLPSTGATRLQRYYEPLRHPRAPSLSLTGFRLVIADHALGLPVFRALSLCTCCRHYPGAAAGRTLRSASPSRISLPRKGCRVGLRIVLFEACSAFTRVTACTLALSPIRDTLIEGFSHFVSSMTAPVASGWSGCRVGFAPTGKRRLVTAHTHNGRRAWSADPLLIVGGGRKVLRSGMGLCVSLGDH